ncbi:helix-turn-helix domain-containing protein [Pseudonocardia sp. HH130629-09]|uniref:helix-turn-helix domain-containing protein n=1 Tax=Pseudonocardia sp. HH130629-09 TaxID=1641402 RepID=UPI0006CB22CB|nr:XRE family transcriptional regulator [Pseudonocardia sp. HH130629-09]
MGVVTALGEFLAARRARLDPDAFGLPTTGARRVPGLRREELAGLAGVSPSYYTRLEQGHSRGASPAVLDAIARVLALDKGERAHLHRIAATAARPVPLRSAPPECIDARTADLLAAMPDVPAFVLGRSGDVLAWNPLGHALLAAHLDPLSPACPRHRPNLVAMAVLDPHVRALYADPVARTRALVAALRLAAGRRPDDARLSALVGDLSVRSDEFARLWADHRAHPCAQERHTLRHPLVGELTLDHQVLDVGRTPDRTVLVLTAPPGSPDSDALGLLGRQVSG